LKGIAPSRGILAVAALKVNAVVLRRTLLAVARTRLRRRSTIARAGIIGGRGLRGCAGARLRATAASFAARRPSAPWLARLAVGHRRLACAAVAVRVVAAALRVCSSLAPRRRRKAAARRVPSVHSSQTQHASNRSATHGGLRAAMDTSVSDLMPQRRAIARHAPLARSAGRRLPRRHTPHVTNAPTARSPRAARVHARIARVGSTRTNTRRPAPHAATTRTATAAQARRRWPTARRASHGALGRRAAKLAAVARRRAPAHPRNPRPPMMPARAMVLLRRKRVRATASSVRRRTTAFTLSAATARIPRLGAMPFKCTTTATSQKPCTTASYLRASRARSLCANAPAMRR
jgi:hypothetical protein